MTKETSESEPSIGVAFNRFEVAIKALEESNAKITIENVLAALTARDAIHKALIERKQDLTPYLFPLIQYDKKLKKLAKDIPDSYILSDFRSLLNPPHEAWWWFLDEKLNSFWDQFDWLWGALTVPWLAVNASLIIDISSRLLSGNPDSISNFAVVFQSILAALVTGGALTKTGQELVDGFFENLKIPKRFRHEAKLGSAIVISALLIFFRTSLPSISHFYNARGFENFGQGKLDSAKSDFTQALSLNPDFMEAQYNLGRLYEDSQDTKNALIHYSRAAELGSSRAYSNMGRLYNIEGNYSLAVYFLLKGKSLIDRQSTHSSVDKDKDTQYAILRNLGWARLEQKRFLDARAYLEKAINLVPDRASGHCLLAQVLEGLEQKENARLSWHQCHDYAAIMHPEQIPPEVDTWVGIAKKKLQSGSRP